MEMTQCTKTYDLLEKQFREGNVMVNYYVEKEKDIK